MIEERDKKTTLRRMTDSRARLLKTYPFFGRLLMHLIPVVAECGTACTETRHICFDPAFAARLDDEAMDFVLMHEVMHCVLQHCTRGRELDHELYNIACDIVVNSNIMEATGRRGILVDGKSPMHLTPDGREGGDFTAEEVYDLLLKELERRQESESGRGGSGRRKGRRQKGSSDPFLQDTAFDDHSIWKKVPQTGPLSGEWKKNLQEAAAAPGAGGSTPPALRRLAADLKNSSKINWRDALHSFIQICHDTYDYSFLPPDRRFTWSDFAFPSFAEQESEKTEKLWFLIDTSGSMSEKTINMVYSEIGYAIEQLKNLSGMLSFFDTQVTEPIPFSSVQKLQVTEAPGGGGTSFRCMFDYMAEHMTKDLPTALIIMTDGYADFPPEEVTMEVPVLWVLTGTEEVPWGKVVRISEGR